MIRLAVADDHELIRNGLTMIISTRSDMQVTVQAASYQELLEALEQEDVNLLLLDLNLGDINGLSTVEQINARYPSLPILVLSAYPEEAYALRAFKSGALGYLNKSVVSSELVDAILTVMRGEKYVSRTFEEILPFGTDLSPEKKTLGELLSKREFEVLNLIALGKSPKEIAEEMALSPKTVSTYRTRILDKLSLESTAQLQRFAYETFSGNTESTL